MKKIMMTLTAIGLVMSAEAFAREVACPKPGTVKVKVFCNDQKTTEIDGQKWKVTKETEGNLPKYLVITKNTAKLDEGDGKSTKLPPNGCAYKYKLSGFFPKEVHIVPVDPKITATPQESPAEITNPDTCPLGNKAQVVTGTPEEKAKKILDRLVADVAKDDGDALETAKQNALIFAQTCFVGKSPETLVEHGAIHGKLPGTSQTNFKRCVDEQETNVSSMAESIEDYLEQTLGQELSNDDVGEFVLQLLLTHHMNTYVIKKVAPIKDNRRIDYPLLEQKNNGALKVDRKKASDAIIAQLK